MVQAVAAGTFIMQPLLVSMDTNGTWLASILLANTSGQSWLLPSPVLTVLLAAPD